MENFLYVDIYATKGYEYIIAITFLISLVWFWKWLNKPVPGTVGIKPEKGQSVSLVDWFSLANEYYYHQGHSWVYPVKNDTVNVGIDDFAQKLLGTPVKIKLPEIGTKLIQGDQGIQIEIEGKNVDILAPVDGEVIARNEQVLKSPQLINQDPYNKGWLIKVKSRKFNTNLKNMLSGDLAKVWIQDRVDKLSTLINSNNGVVLQDGGTITHGFIRELAPDNWEQIVEEFFLTGDLKIDR